MLPFQYRPWTEVDLEELVSARQPENRQIEYKRTLPDFVGKVEGKSPTHEFLADVSAFANAGGGAILFGIDEEAGLPQQIVGVETPDMDGLVLQLSQKLEAGLDPVLRGFEFDAPLMKDGKRVVVLRIPQSPNAPHMIVVGTRNFYTRSAAGKTKMDVTDLRSAFLSSGSLAEKANEFIDGRLAKIAGRKNDFPLEDGGHLIFHVIPLSSLQRPDYRSIEALMDHSLDLRPMRQSGWSPVVVLDGFASTSSDRKGRYFGYSLVFRNGIIEASCPCSHTDDKGTVWFNEGAAINALAKAGPEYEKFLNQLNYHGPYILSVAFVSCKGARIYVDPAYGSIEIRTVAEEVLRIPAIEVIDPVNWHRGLKEIFDLISNYFGRAFCPHFNADGSLKHPR